MALKKICLECEIEKRHRALRNAIGRKGEKEGNEGGQWREKWMPCIPTMRFGERLNFMNDTESFFEKRAVLKRTSAPLKQMARIRFCNDSNDAS